MLQPLPLTPSHIPQSSSPLLLSLNNLDARQELEAVPRRIRHHLRGCPGFSLVCSHYCGGSWISATQTLEKLRCGVGRKPPWPSSSQLRGSELHCSTFYIDLALIIQDGGFQLLLSCPYLYSCHNMWGTELSTRAGVVMVACFMASHRASLHLLPLLPLFLPVCTFMSLVPSKEPGMQKTSYKWC